MKTTKRGYTRSCLCRIHHSNKGKTYCIGTADRRIRNHSYTGSTQSCPDKIRHSNNENKNKTYCIGTADRRIRHHSYTGNTPSCLGKIRHSNKGKNLLYWHCRPANPPSQLHRKYPVMSWQDPPFKQGWLLQSSMSVITTQNTCNSCSL